MMKRILIGVTVFIFLAIMAVPAQALVNSEPPPQKKDNMVVKVAVIGGMTMTGMWGEITKLFEAKTGIKVEVVDTGPRPEIEVPFKQGKVDLLTMHSGDITTDLVADGYGIEMKPWTHNNIVIIGPSNDPAGIKGMKSGAKALKKIATTRSNFIDLWGIGMREVSQKMWKKAGTFPPIGNWVIKDERRSKKEILIHVREKNAYTFFGRVPVLFQKRDSKGLEIMVEDDPDMHRPYIVMLANPEVFPHVNFEGARKLQDFLLSRQAQKFLGKFRADEFGGIPLFYPLRRKAFKVKNL
jgi:tungstate transport system substrate-binding protein